MSSDTPSSRLQQEIRQTVPFRSAGQEATLALARTADVVQRRFERVLEPFGLTGQQYNVLRILRGARGEPLPTLEIAERMIQRAPGITRLVDRLERKGLVQRERCETDRRIVFCRITSQGLELLAATDLLVDTLDDEVETVLDVQELQVLTGYLERIRCRFSGE